MISNVKIAQKAIIQMKQLCVVCNVILPVMQIFHFILSHLMIEIRQID